MLQRLAAVDGAAIAVKKTCEMAQHAVINLQSGVAYMKERSRKTRSDRRDPCMPVTYLTRRHPSTIMSRFTLPL
jgi:hypothetical protein